jgi:FecR protein
MKNQWVLCLAIAIGISMPVCCVRADDYSRIRIVRLSLVDGEVQYQRPEGELQDARLNLPIEEGFKLRTAQGYAEVEFEDSMTLRLGTSSTVEFSGLSLENGSRLTTLNLSEGTVIFSAKLRRGDSVSVASPELNVTVPHDCRFRIDSAPDMSFVSVFHGKVNVAPAKGANVLLSGGKTLRVDADSANDLQIVSNPPQDEFDKWVAHRDGALNVSQRETASMVRMDSYTMGFSDLFDYGVWSDIPGYGMGWAPYGVGANWMPFVNGQWQFMGAGVGWSWISAEPWGWLPYHFGSWVNAPGVGWAWLPIGTTAWTPATAHWVRINDQLGWVPNGPQLGAKPTKAQLSAAPSTTVVASLGAGGAITAGTRMAVQQSGVKIEMAPTPEANLATPVASATMAVKSSVFTSPTTSASLRMPSATSPFRMTGPIAAPRTLIAPHAPLVRPIERHPGLSEIGANIESHGVSPAMNGSSVNVAVSKSGRSSAPHSRGSSRGHR